MSQSSRQRCTATIICFNEEGKLRECLESMKWADEIVVIDSGSTDRTTHIAKEFTDKVFFNPWPGMREQKNFATGKASNPWIFNIDADERVTSEGAAEIQRALAAPQNSAYDFPRKNIFLGRWMRHGGWYPDRVIRLFRKDSATFGGVNPHTAVIPNDGRVSHLKEPLVHYTYDSFEHYISKQFPYSNAAALEISRKKSSPTTAAVILIRTGWKFIEAYIIKRGFLDGSRGMIVALGAAFTMYMRQARLWELKRDRKD